MLAVIIGLAELAQNWPLRKSPRCKSVMLNSRWLRSTCDLPTKKETDVWPTKKSHACWIPCTRAYKRQELERQDKTIQNGGDQDATYNDLCESQPHLIKTSRITKKGNYLFAQRLERSLRPSSLHARPHKRKATHLPSPRTTVRRRQFSPKHPSLERMSPAEVPSDSPPDLGPAMRDRYSTAYSPGELK